MVLLDLLLMEVKKILLGCTFANNESIVPRFLATFAIQIY
jgi:hypothetical protein